MMGKTKANNKKSINPFLRISPTATEDETPENSLGRLTSANDQLSKIEEYLNSVIDSLHDNPSFLTRVANRWGELPGWAKIVGGIVFFGIFFTLGILAHLVVIIAITAVTATGFTISSVMLDDHYKASKRSKDTLKSGMLSLGNLLKSTIMALDKICEQLVVEVDKFKQENNRLAEYVSLINEDLRTLHSEMDALSGTKEALTALELKFEKTSMDYEAFNRLLKERIDELERIKIKMASQMKEQEGMVSLLQGTLETFSAKLFGDEADKSQFLQKMRDFIQDGSASFATIADRICQAETELLRTQHALEESNKRYDQLIEKHTALLERYDKSLSDSLMKDRSTNIQGFHPFFSRADIKKLIEPELKILETMVGVNPTS